MLPELGIKARRRAWMAGLGHEAAGNESPQDAVDRHARDLGKLATYGATLGCDRQAAFAMGGEEMVHALLFDCRAHDYRMNIRTR